MNGNRADIIKDFGSRFPNLKEDLFTVSSPINPDYNCFAFALGRTDVNIDPEAIKRPMIYKISNAPSEWPREIVADMTLISFIKLFESKGNYRECEDRDYDPCLEKIALYVKDDIITHAARQMQNQWVSKLGSGYDINHTTLEALEGPQYGTVKVIMSRTKQN